jgi:hypothetical protein
MRIRDGKKDPGWKKGSGIKKSRIRDKHPGSATLSGPPTFFLDSDPTKTGSTIHIDTEVCKYTTKTTSLYRTYRYPSI